MIDERVAASLRDMHARLTQDATLRSPSELAGYHDLFRERFGPDRLKSLDGEPLLRLMHGRVGAQGQATKDSLVYWLEFKSDDEFPPIFGGIAGGSALKFGFYQRSETGR